MSEEILEKKDEFVSENNAEQSVENSAENNAEQSVENSADNNADQSVENSAENPVEIEEVPPLSDEELIRGVALVEAVFYLEGEPMDAKVLAKITGYKEGQIPEIIESLKDKYDAADSGIEIQEIGGGWLVSPKRDLWEALKDRYGKKNSGKLSKSAMETLSIIAYSQPITRAEIEALRGVSADNMIRLLVERNLIKEVGRKDVPGKPVQFGTTKEFLKFFRLKSIADLPKLEKAEDERFELAR